MKKTSLVNLFLVSIFLFSAFSLSAQEDCTTSLKKAQKLYNEGIIEKVESILQPCLQKGGLSLEESLQSYRLIILANIYDEKIQDAERNMLKFLELEPEYVINPATDPEEFSEMMSNFQTSPLWSVGIIAGTNFIFPTSNEQFGTYNVSDVDNLEFENNGFSFLAGFRLNRHIIGNLNAQVELLYEQNQFKYRVNPDFNSILQVETQSNLVLPISVTYDFLSHKKLRPFARVGFATNYLLSSKVDLERKYTDFSPNRDEVASNTNITDQRRSINFDVIAGVGLKFKVKRANIVFDAKYNHGLNNMLKDEQRYSEDNYDRIFRFQHIDDDFKIDKIGFTIGYVRNIYKPRKKKLIQKNDNEL